MIINILKNDYSFTESDTLLSTGVRQHLRYISGEISYLSLMETNSIDVDPGTYLKYAKCDLIEQDDRCAINAVGNAKRAVHLLIDNFFELLGLFNTYKKVKFPEKLLLIQKLEAFPTRLIDSLNKTRNEVEHAYKKISINKAEEFVEIAEMFYLLCLPFLKHIVNSVHVGLINDDRDIMYLLNPYESKISIHECKKSSSIIQPNGKVYYNFSNDKSDLPVLQLIEIRKKNINDWLPILNTLIYVTKKEIIPQTPPYDPNKFERIMCFSTLGTYFDPDSVESA